MCERTIIPIVLIKVEQRMCMTDAYVMTTSAKIRKFQLRNIFILGTQKLVPACPFLIWTFYCTYLYTDVGYHIVFADVYAAQLI